MKFRKEYLHFLVVVVALILCIVLYVVFASRPWSADFSVKDSNSGSDELISSSDSEDLISAVTPPVEEHDKLGGNETMPSYIRENPDVALVESIYGDQQTDGQSPESSASPNEVTDTDELGNQDSGDGGDIYIDTSIYGDPRVDELDFNAYGGLVMCYVCGVDNELYSDWLSPSLYAELGSLTGEPYDALSGNFSFEDIQYSEYKVSFKAGNGVMYEFGYTLDNSVIASIEYIQ